MKIPAILVLLSFGGVSLAGDWPMWRGDAQRSGATAEALADQLHLLWSREFPRPALAWENESRLHFDASYHPVVTGKTMVVASPNDGSVAAFDTETGSERWRRFTNGPVRVAPVASGGKIFVGSDDGYFYCLDEKSGEELWRIRAAPEDRPEYYHLGNDRLVSCWPVRGGPVVSEDGQTVYFGSGIWPSMGVFVFAADTGTGKLRWSNSNSHYLPDTRVDHNYLHESGISPQGHMSLAGDRLVVANGRSMPARLDRETGELLHFVQGYRNGDSRVSIVGDHALIGERGVMDLATGLEVGAAPWLEAGEEAPKGFSLKQLDQFEGPYHQYKFQKGCDHRSVLHEGVAYGAEKGVVYAYDVVNATVSRYDSERSGNALKPARWEAPLLWEFPVAIDGEPSDLTPNAILKAGGRLYTHFGNRLVALDLSANRDTAPLVAWTRELPEAPAELLAADGKLFAVGENGGLFCFSDAERETLVYERTGDGEGEVKPPAPDSRAGRLLAESGATEGYALVLGVVEGDLVRDLVLGTELRVIAIDPDESKLDDLRREFSESAVLGERFQAIAADPGGIRLPPYLANLLTSEDPGFDPAGEDFFHALRPYGGVACVEKVDGSFTTRRREGALPGAADWTHETGDAARSFFSADKLVKAPLAVLWYGDGDDHGFHKPKDYGHGVKPQAAGGRLFALQLPSNILHAVDSYTGRLLWKAKVDDSARYVSREDAIYVAQGRTVDVLDPATGKTAATWELAIAEVGAGDPVSATDIRVTDDLVVLGLRFNEENRVEKGRWESELLVVLERESGRQLWTRRARHRYSTAAIAIGPEAVFCIDSHSPIEVQAMGRRGDDISKLKSTILSLDARTGEERWKSYLENPPAELGTIHFLGVRTSDDWLAVAAGQGLLLAGKNARTVALRLDTGEEAWSRDTKGQQPLIITGETFINQAGHTYETATGKLLNGDQLFTRGGCNYAVGCENLVFLRDNCAAYVEIESREQHNLRNLRSGCSASLVAAGGLLNAPCFSVGCVCNYPIQTSFAMYHLPEAGDWNRTVPEIAAREEGERSGAEER